MYTFINAGPVIAANPHPAFDRVLSLGYSLAYRRDPERSLRCLVVQATHTGGVAAEADFGDDGFAVHCQNIAVGTAHRRRGLATAIYLLAESVCGKPIWNYWNGDEWQSPEAAAL